MGIRNTSARDIVLDAGSGSGILCNRKEVGSRLCTCVDIDPLATKTAIYNAGLNKIDPVNGIPKMAILLGDIVALPQETSWMTVRSVRIGDTPTTWLRPIY